MRRLTTLSQRPFPTLFRPPIQLASCLLSKPILSWPVTYICRDYSTRPNDSAKTIVSSHFVVDESEIIQFLERKGLIFKLSGKEIVLKYCNFCSKPHFEKPDNLWKLYIDRHSGAFFCHRCQYKGNWCFFAHHRIDFKRAPSDISQSIFSPAANFTNKEPESKLFLEPAKATQFRENLDGKAYAPVL